MKAMQRLVLGLSLFSYVPMAWPTTQARAVFLLSSGNSMPMLEVKNDQPQRGILKDVALALASELNRQAQFKVLPRKRLEQELVSGSADLYCYTMPKWLSADVQWSQPLIRNHDVIATRADTRPPKSLGELKGKPLGTVLGYVYPELEQTLGPAFRRDDGFSETQNLRKLLANRHNYLLISEAEWLYLRSNPTMRAQLNPDYLRISSYDNYCALSRKSSISLQSLNSAIAKLKKQNRFTAIQSQYY
ncbi:transporter substrate-binding domain-containing protein [Chitinibacter fontanus]|uniref:Transporter substrate-binding domain-containing protein n=1 Tax=Chitinibacter fontanus TaxID=1737446 RepID=A0A7D5Z908_9NEIS|nr:transporter substrate-binding domain-containing protein [Chitinibacter fontanus]QLI82382.1 transporter substrate-binding domain-containing protein [Chitinibacter fontanus]